MSMTDHEFKPSKPNEQDLKFIDEITVMNEEMFYKILHRECPCPEKFHHQAGMFPRNLDKYR